MGREHRFDTRQQGHQFRKCLANGNLNQKVRSKTLQESFIQSLKWTPDLSMVKSFDAKRVFLCMLKSFDEVTKTLKEWDPLVLAAKANAEDTPDWNMAMNGPNAEGFWEACKVEINTLEDKDVWEVVERQSWMNVLPSTWAFKVKRYPDGLVKKLKARFCVRGDKQIQHSLLSLTGTQYDFCLYYQLSSV